MYLQTLCWLPGERSLPIGLLVFWSKPIFMYYRTGSLPPNLQTYESTGNGDCLFNSVSLALFGNERYAYRLRLAAVCDAILKSRQYKKVVGSI